MKFVVLAAAAAALGAAPAMAQSSDQSGPFGFYGDLGWGETTVQGMDLGSITGRLGGRYGKFLGLEGELSYGVMGDNRTFGANTADARNVDVKRQLDGAVYGVGFLPVSPNMDLLARVGYGWSHYRVSPASLASYTASEHGLRYGVGAQYFLAGNNGVRLDWTREQMDILHDAGFFSADKQANVWAATFTHRF
jgi:hypothetical protein